MNLVGMRLGGLLFTQFTQFDFYVPGNHSLFSFRCVAHFKVPSNIHQYANIYIIINSKNLCETFRLSVFAVKMLYRNDARAQSIAKKSFKR